MFSLLLWFDPSAKLPSPQYVTSDLAALPLLNQFSLRQHVYSSWGHIV